MRLFFTFICSLFFLHTSTAQYSAKASVDSTFMMIGDQQKLHLDVVYPSGTALLPLVFKKNTEDAIEFLAQTRWDTLSESSSVRIKKDILFTAWDSGYQTVPPIPIVFLKNGERDTIYTIEIPIEVMAPPIDSILADIKPIIEEPIVWTDYIPALSVVVLLLLVAIVWFIASRIKTDMSLPPPPPVIVPAHEIAFQKLKELKKSKLWQQGQVKEFHSQLTHIIREYLEGRYGVQALEQTTDEILEQMKNKTFEPGLTEKMTTLLQTADLVKFAKAEPPADYHDSALALGEEFVRATKRIVLPQEGGGAATQ